MAMQYDVKSVHNTVSGLAVGYRTRLKGVLISPSTAVTFNTTFCNNLSQSGTYNIPGSTTCTVTIANHGLTTGDRVYLDFTTGTAQDQTYVVTVTSPSAFTVTTASLTTSGNVTMDPEILVEFDCSNGTAFYTLIPGEGILAQDGIYVGIPNVAITTTLFHG